MCLQCASLRLRSHLPLSYRSACHLVCTPLPDRGFCACRPPSARVNSDFATSIKSEGEPKKAHLIVKITGLPLCSLFLVQPHEPVNVLKRPDEDDLVVVWAQQGQVLWLCEAVLVVLVRPKEQEPPESEAIPRRSRCDRSARRP